MKSAKALPRYGSGQTERRKDRRKDNAKTISLPQPNLLTITVDREMLQNYELASSAKIDVLNDQPGSHKPYMDRSLSIKHRQTDRQTDRQKDRQTDLSIDPGA
ncbi:hypothetical protein DPMN_110391 [Dreissena polymorpha]|uniref:Uncharacterized protein n=1 Tax=Dreissena polymorpha TaxID=45954 RepID=A0A9D4QN04_DREPO|nr:hypothetical protein DPMN_110391 [Dreissena polymorpha]